VESSFGTGREAREGEGESVRLNEADKSREGARERKIEKLPKEEEEEENTQPNRSTPTSSVHVCVCVCVCNCPI